jgi:hypothetical protein
LDGWDDFAVILLIFEDKIFCGYYFGNLFDVIHVYTEFDSGVGGFVLIFCIFVKILYFFLD